jgi:hypothetical protein
MKVFVMMKIPTAVVHLLRVKTFEEKHVYLAERKVSKIERAKESRRGFREREKVSLSFRKSFSKKLAEAPNLAPGLRDAIVKCPESSQNF